MKHKSARRCGRRAASRNDSDAGTILQRKQLDIKALGDQTFRGSGANEAGARAEDGVEEKEAAEEMEVTEEEEVEEEKEEEKWEDAGPPPHACCTDSYG